MLRAMVLRPMILVSCGIKACGLHVVKILKGLKDSIVRGPRSELLSQLARLGWIWPRDAMKNYSRLVSLV